MTEPFTLWAIGRIDIGSVHGTLICRAAEDLHHGIFQFGQVRVLIEVVLHLLERIITSCHRLNSIIFNSIFRPQKCRYEMIRRSRVRANYRSQAIIFHKISSIRTAVVAPQEMMP